MKKHLISIVSLMLCIAVLAGSTYAWFTDSAVSNDNIVQSGGLDIKLYWALDLENGPWVDTEKAEGEKMFASQLWEPGYTEVRYYRVENAGDLAFQYALQILPDGKVSDLAKVIDVYFIENPTENIRGRNDLANMIPVGTLADVINGETDAVGSLLAGEDVTFAVALKMRESAGNEYQGLSIGSTFNLVLHAAQFAHEEDSFGPDYDQEAELPFIFPDGTINGSASEDVTVENGAVKETVTLKDDAAGVSALIPAGVQVAEGVETLKLVVTDKTLTDSNVTITENEQLRALEVHVEGVSPENTVPMTITLTEVAPKGLNAGNLALYHVEQEQTIPMIQVDTADAFTAHNQFKYDPATGNVTLYMATFSEVAVVADTVNAWEGGVDHSWYVGKSSPYFIANADQLWSFSQIVGGMAKDDGGNAIAQDSFSDKTVNLICDINLGDAEAENKSNLIFYPIGYYNSTGSYEKTSGGSVTSSVSSFEGTFNGNGHTIANIYQNTWEMFGAYNNGYTGTPNHYKDAMGLFGYIYGGTVKNLTVDNFSSDGEFTPTGVIAAYADGNATFENIAITHCNPRVYNTGNGGIIGIAGDTSAANDDHITLKNITVDNTNKISALWGSWDVACGGLVGMYRGNVDGSGNATGDTISFTNCHVSAQIDVYNDVCANYQYYAYRYAGMIIGSIRHNEVKDGKTIPNMTGISATGCTVNYGDWNDYYYCEFEKNSIASYSEDYQFSRVPHSELNFTDSNGNGVVDADERTSVTGCKHTHTAEENHQAIYLPFHQLFTGYSWGVSSIGLKEYSGIVTDLDIEESDKNTSVVKFAAKYDSDPGTEGVQTPFLYRVGNKNTVKAGTLFTALADAAIVDSGVFVSVTSMYDENVVMGSFKPDATDWTKGEITFSKTGPVKVTIQDYQYCKPTVLYLEVVDGYNVTAKSAEDKTLIGWTNNGSNVLLEHASIASNGTLTLANGALYGNGFTLDASNAAYSGVDMDSKSFVISVANAKIDNVTIKGKVYPELGTKKDDEYYRPLLFVSGSEKCTITNSTLSGTASPIRTGCDLELINVTLNGGAYANLDMRGGNLVLDNVTTINQGTREGLFGFGVVVYQEGGSDDMSITIRNSLNQYNFVSKTHADSVTDTNAKAVLTLMFGDDYTTYHFVDADGVKWLNSGIISMNDLFEGEADIIDERPAGHNYVRLEKNETLLGETRKCYVYSFRPSSSDISKTPGSGSSDQNIIAPTVTFNHVQNNLVPSEDQPNDYCTANGGVVTISMDEGDPAFGWNPAILKATKSGKNLAYTASTTVDGSEYIFTVQADGTVAATKAGAAYTDEIIPFVTDGTYQVTYKFTDPYNFGVNEDGELVRYDKEYTETLEVKVITVKPSAYHAVFSFGANGTTYSSRTESIDTDGTVKTYVMPDVTAVVDGKIGSTTVNGITVYYPITEMYTNDGVTKHAGSWYACFPIFKDAVQIIDYADKGTGDEVKYNQTNVTTVDGIPSTLKATNPTSAFLYSMNATNYPPPTDPTAVSGAVCYTCNRNGLTSSNARDEMTIIAEYEYTDNIGATYYYYVGYHCAAQEKGSSLPCVTPDTLITLADGTQKEIQNVRVGDEVLAWNFYTGSYEIVPVSLLQAHSTGIQNILHLYFEDGTELKILGEHGVFDADLNTFVFVDEHDAADYVGHRFVKQNGDGFTAVKLVDYEVTTEYTTAYTILSTDHYNVMAEGMFTVTPAHVGGNFFNPFNIGEDMKYDAEAVKADIEKYGLYTYEDFDHVLTYEQFEALNLGHFKVSVGKGLVTYEGLVYLIETFINGDY